MTARSAAEIRADLADCDRDGLPWPSAARRVLADVPDLLARLEAVKALPDQWEARAAIGEAHDYNAAQFRTAASDLRAALSVAPQPQPDPIGKPCAIAPAVGGLVYDRNDARCWHEGGLWHDLSVAPQPQPATCIHGEYEAHDIYRPDSGTYAVRCPGPAPEQSR